MKSIQYWLTAVRCFVVFSAVSVLTLSGCNSENKPQGMVTGKVLLDKIPLGEGEISFYSSQRGVGSVATLDANGAFSFTDPLEVGSYSVSVSPSLRDPVPGKAAPKVTASPIPRKYRDVATSQLNYTVESGTNNFTIELKK